jgi:hypothetical protein
MRSLRWHNADYLLSSRQRSELSYWRDLVETYFSENGYLSLDLKSTSKGDTKHFGELPSSCF